MTIWRQVRAVTVVRIGIGRLLTLLLLVAAAACARTDGGPERGFEVRDSAGVRIAESAQALWSEGEGWRLSDAPEVEIGLAEGPPAYLLSGVTSALRRSDGSIVLVNGGSQEVRFYDVEGRHLRSVGRRGGGPGEFQQLFWIDTVRGDTLLAYDFPARRLSVLGPEGAFVRASTLDDLDGLPQVLPPLADGSLVVQTRTYQDSEVVGSGTRRGVVGFLHLSASGELLDTILVSEPFEQYRTTMSSGGATMTTVMPKLFGASMIAATAGDSILVGSNDRYELGVYGPDGELRRIVRRLIAPRPVTEEMLQASARQSERSLESMDNPGARDLFREARENRPHAETLPFFMRVLVDEVGNAWVMEFLPPESEARPPWTVFDRDGRMLGSLVFPERFTPRQIGADFVLGVARDELDVERVQLFSLVKK